MNLKHKHNSFTKCYKNKTIENGKHQNIVNEFQHNTSPQSNK